MTKFEFLSVLEKHLKPLPKEEIKSALEYYSDYIDEMPEDSREEQIEKLGNPKHIASRIMAEFSVENGTTKNVEEAEDKPSEYRMVQSASENKTKNKSSVSVWTLVFAVLSAPITIPFAIALVAILVALVAVFGAVVVAIFAVVFAVGVSGVAVFVAGVLAFQTSIANGLIMLGVGLVLVGLTNLLVLGALKLTKSIYLLIKMIISKIIQRRYSKDEEKHEN
ncbi:MAG: DUF1700 domain-containing protein [Bacillota bacterium]